MLYGYAVKKEWLISYGKRHKLFPSTEGFEEDSDCDLEPNEVDYEYETLCNAVNHILGSAGFFSTDSEVGLLKGKRKTPIFVLAIASNDTNDQLPSPSTGLPTGKRLEDLQTILKTKKNPMWYPCVY